MKKIKNIILTSLMLLSSIGESSAAGTIMPGMVPGTLVVMPGMTTPMVVSPEMIRQEAARQEAIRQEAARQEAARRGLGLGLGLLGLGLGLSHDRGGDIAIRRPFGGYRGRPIPNRSNRFPVLIPPRAPVLPHISGRRR